MTVNIKMLQGHFTKITVTVRCQCMYDASNKVVFRSWQNDSSEVLALPDDGRAFQVRAADTGTVWSPSLVLSVDGTGTIRATGVVNFGAQ